MNPARTCFLSLILIRALAPIPVRADGEPAKTYPLWPAGSVPGAVGKEEADVPTIAVYRPSADKAVGSAVVVCPGGGYRMLAMDHEGKQVAEWLNGLGVTAVVLKYRLAPRYKHPSMLQDVQRAIRTTRARAKEWGVDPKRVAVLGFSAGGHLASTAATHFDEGRPNADDPIERESSRPDRAILIYPVVAISTPYAHGGSRDNLLGKDAAKELVESLSNELRVTSRTPPTFLAHTNEDAAVPAENSILFALALRKAKVPVELHLFEKGPHGLGLGNGTKQFKIAGDPAFAKWPELCAIWLDRQGFLSKESK